MIIVQEDTRQREIIKNVRKQIKEQEQQVQAMMMVGHESDCDIFNCSALVGKSKFCFKPKADKIVHEST